MEWYPGHMAKTKKSLLENIFLIDIIIELLDARIPMSSKNPDIAKLAADKHRILLLNKCDMANSNITQQWINFFDYQNVFAISSLTNHGFNRLNETIDKISKERMERLKQRGRVFKPTRVMIVGIPNVGKSTFINRFVKKNIAKAANRPGVTLHKQWIKLRKDIELLDTPGILSPKLNEPNAFANLAITGAIKQYDVYNTAVDLITRLQEVDERIIKTKLNIDLSDSNEILNQFAINRCILKRHGECDLEKAAAVLLDEFRNCKLGSISLERPIIYSQF